MAFSRPPVNTLNYIFFEFGRRSRFSGFLVGTRARDAGDFAHGMITFPFCGNQPSEFREKTSISQYDSFMGIISTEEIAVRLRGTGPTALHFCLTMLTQAGIWDYSLIKTSGFDRPFFLVFIKSVDLRAVLYRIGAAAGDKDKDDEKRSLGHEFVRSVWDDDSAVFPPRQMRYNYDVSHDLQAGVNAIREFEANRHVIRGGLAGHAYGQEAAAVGGGLHVNNGSRGVLHVALQRYADVRASQAEKPVVDALESKFEMYVMETEGVHVMVPSGSTNQKQWETSYFCFGDLPDEDYSAILDGVRERTLFKLEDRAGGGDHNSVVVLTSAFSRHYLIRVKTNAYDFDDRPLVNPCEENCRSATRMLKYARMLTMTDEVCTLGAAVSTRYYFGADAFDSVFRSYRYFCDSMFDKKRVVACIDDVYQTACFLSQISNREASHYERFYGYAFGGDKPGPFETEPDELRAMYDLAADTGRCPGAIKMICFPSDPDEVSIFHGGQRYPN